MNLVMCKSGIVNLVMCKSGIVNLFKCNTAALVPPTLYAYALYTRLVFISVVLINQRNSEVEIYPRIQQGNMQNELRLEVGLP